jgi:hypothetical protein
MIFSRTTEFLKPYHTLTFLSFTNFFVSSFHYNHASYEGYCKMEFSRTNINETIIENECFDIIPNQVSMEEVCLIEPMEKHKNLRT